MTATREAIGTIRGREAKQVVADILQERGISPSLWAIRSDGLHILVRGRQVIVPFRAGLTVYGLDAVRRRVEALCDESRKPHDARQIDIEDAIREARP
jgi:hypothetical protein